MDMQNVKDLAITEGDVRTIHDSNGNLLWGRLAYDTKYAGDTEQDGTPSQDTPVPIQVVTGEQTVTVSDGVNSHDYTVNLSSKKPLADHAILGWVRIIISRWNKLSFYWW